MDLSFSGAGFMGCYYFGVADCLNKYIPRERIKRVAGASAGSLIASYYILGLPMDVALREIVTLTEEMRQRTFGVFDRNHQVVDMLPAVLDRLFPEDAHKIASGPLHVCMTRLKDMKKVIVNQFDTRQELIDALNCSCFIPVWSGNHVPTYKGEKHIDGGFKDNLPVFDEHTIRICCFSGCSDISPVDRTRLELLKGKVLNTPLYFNLANFARFRKALFPPPAEFFLNLVQRGFHDTKNYILSNDLIKCNSCYKASLDHLPVLPEISPAVSPSVTRSNSFRNLEDLASDKQNQQNKSSGLLLSPPKTGSTEPMKKEAKRLQKEDKKALKEMSRKLETELKKHAKLSNQNTIPDIIIKNSESDDEAAEGDSLAPSSGSPDTTLKSNTASPTKNHQQQQIISSKENPFDLSSNLVLPEKFTMAPNSCPPSPSLKRHCPECLRLRQEARLDNIEEILIQELEKFPRGKHVQQGKIAGTITKPIKWLRQLRMRSTYNFNDNNNNNNDIKTSTNLSG